MAHYFFKINRNGQIASMAAAFSLHAGIAAWALAPSAPVVIPQQVINIAMVAPSSLAETVSKPELSEEPLLPTPPKPDGLKKQAEKQPQHLSKPKQTLEKLAKQNSKLSPTSGVSRPDATAKESAITEPVFDAAYLNNPAPYYPDSARRRGVQGKTMLQVQVAVDGAAHDVTVLRSSGSDLLDSAALDAVKRWRFVPAKRGGEMVEAKVVVPIEFKLN